MKQIMKQFAARITAFLNRLGEDFDMVLLDDRMAYYTDMTGFEFEDELFA